MYRAVRARAPEANVVYFGDLKNAPYGNKSREELGVLTVLGIQKLIDAGATEIVSACNSVSVSIVLPMFEILNLPRVNLIEMVGPTVASFRGQEAKVLVLATQATIDSKVYQDGFRMLGIEADGLAVPDLVFLIEGGASEVGMKGVVRRVLEAHPVRDYTHVLLGCTHFPLVRSVFESIVDELGMTAATVTDPANAVANAVLERFDTDGSGQVQCIASMKSELFQRFAAESGIPPSAISVL